MILNTEVKAAMLSSPKRRSGNRKLMNYLLPYLFVLPLLLLVFSTIVYPMFETLLISFSKVNRIGKVEHVGSLDNFRNLFQTNPVGQISWQTLIWVVATVGVAFVLGYLIAIALNKKFRLRSVAYALIVLPWAAPLSIATMGWEWIFHGELGPLNQILQSLHLIKAYHQWLATPSSALLVVLIVGIWSNISFIVVVLLAGLQSITPDLYEAASLDGAGPVVQFFKITFPLMRPVNNLVIVLSVLWAFNAFPIIWILTQGGPASSTDIVVTLIYKLSFVGVNFGQASALSTITLVAMCIFTVVYFWLGSRGDNRGTV